jgi:uncharacterized membrane protein YGL010W
MSRSLFTRPAFELLVMYARYHRDQRNITTHLVGVPMVAFGMAMLLSRSTLQLGDAVMTPAWLAFGALALWTLSRGEPALGVATTLVTAVLVGAAHGLNVLPYAPWLALGLALVVLGCIVQYVGHYYEGRRQALADDPTRLLVGPMFVVLEMLARAGFCRELTARVEQAAGPTMLRDLAQPLARG